MGSYFQCPNCKVTLKKSPDQEASVQGLEFSRRDSRLVKCPSCGNDIDRSSIIGGDYDIKTSMWSKPKTEKNQFDWTNEAEKLASKGKNKEALKSIEKSLDLDPHFGYAWQVKATLVGDDDEKLCYLNEALRDNSGYSILNFKGPCLTAKATILFKQDDYDEALECANEASNFLQKGKFNNLNEFLIKAILIKKRKEESE